MERLQQALTLAVKSLDELNVITYKNFLGHHPHSDNDSSATQSKSDSDFALWLRSIIKLREARKRFLPSEELFAEPAWDMLLDLSLWAIHKKKVSVTSLCIAARVPTTTALRWVTVLEKMGFIERTQDATDARRSFLAISEKGLDAMWSLYRHSRSAS